ncbi:unnamed protein product [Colias eurytheme]|nr:unnamed protein product [Colias eurytheme]
MDNTKHPIPNLPSPQCILEDLSDSGILQLEEPLQLSLNDDPLREAFDCYTNLKKLNQGLQKHDVLNSELEKLDKELVDNIETIKNQQFKENKME